MISRTSYGLRDVGVDDAVDLRRVVARILGRGHVGRQRASTVFSVDDDRPRTARSACSSSSAK